MALQAEILDILLQSLKSQAEKYKELIDSDLGDEDRKGFDVELSQMFDLLTSMSNSSTVLDSDTYKDMITHLSLINDNFNSFTVEDFEIVFVGLKDLLDSYNSDSFSDFIVSDNYKHSVLSSHSSYFSNSLNVNSFKSSLFGEDYNFITFDTFLNLSNSVDAISDNLSSLSNDIANIDISSNNIDLSNLTLNQINSLKLQLGLIDNYYDMVKSNMFSYYNNDISAFTYRFYAYLENDLDSYFVGNYVTQFPFNSLDDFNYNICFAFSKDSTLEGFENNSSSPYVIYKVDNIANTETMTLRSLDVNTSSLNILDITSDDPYYTAYKNIIPSINLENNVLTITLTNPIMNDDEYIIYDFKIEFFKPETDFDVITDNTITFTPSETNE